jgi:hypothetical protein
LRVNPDLVPQLPIRHAADSVHAALVSHGSERDDPISRKAVHFIETLCHRA